MTSAFLAGLVLVALTVNAFAQSQDPSAVVRSVAQCPSAQAAFAKLSSLKEPTETADTVNSCSYIATLRSDSDAYVSELHKCAAHGLQGLDDEIQRAQALMSTLPDTPQICRFIERVSN